MHISVDAVNVMAAYQPVVLTCVHCGGRIDGVICLFMIILGHAVAQLVEALRYKPEDAISDGVIGIFH